MISKKSVIMIGLLIVIAIVSNATERARDVRAAAEAGCHPVFERRLPLEMHEHDATVAVEVDGHPVQFALDTGASDTYITAEGRDRFALPATARPPTWRVNTPEGTRNLSAFYDAGSLRLAGTEFGPRALPLTDLGYAATSPARAVEMGLLGTDLLKRYEVDLDIPGHAMTLYLIDPTCREVAPAWAFASSSVPLTLRRSGTPMLDVKMDGVQLRAVLDSGAARTTIEYDEDDDEDAASMHLVESAASDGPNLIRVKSLSVGGVTEAPFSVGVANRPLGEPNNTRLGIDFIARHRMWLSLTTRRLFIKDASP